MLFLTLLSVAATAQHVEMQRVTDEDLPELLKIQFETTFPKAEKVKWYREIERFSNAEDDPGIAGFYKVNFKLNKLKKTSVFDAKGNLIETLTTISRRELPDAVSKSFSRNFEGYRIGKLRMAEKGRAIYFEGDVVTGGTVITFLFDSNGQLVEKLQHSEMPKKIGTIR